MISQLQLAFPFKYKLGIKLEIFNAVKIQTLKFLTACPLCETVLVVELPMCELSLIRYERKVDKASPVGNTGSLPFKSAKLSSTDRDWCFCKLGFVFPNPVRSTATAPTSVALQSSFWRSYIYTIY